MSRLRNLDTENNAVDKTYNLVGKLSDINVAFSKESDERHDRMETSEELRTSYVDLQERTRKIYFDAGWWSGCRMTLGALLIGGLAGCLIKGPKSKQG